MKNCEKGVQYDPSKRHTFAEIVKILKNLELQVSKSQG